MKNFKKKNLLRVGWIVGIYVILALILYLVVDYKVKWEDRDLNTYLYFYNCSGDLCTTTTKPTYYFGSVVCENNECPYIKEKYESYLTLKKDNKEFIYNYKKDKIINNSYITYKLINDNNYIVSDKTGKYSVIDNTGKVIVEPTKMNITDYNNDYIAYKENDKYGIYNEKEEINILPTYEEVKLINSTLYTYLEKDSYYIASYNTEVSVNNTKYDYVLPINNEIIFTFNDNKLDIIDHNLISKLLLKIDCKYSYKEEKERATLNIKKDSKFIYFTIYNENNEFDEYVYDIKNKKLHS